MIVISLATKALLRNFSLNFPLITYFPNSTFSLFWSLGLWGRFWFSRYFAFRSWCSPYQGQGCSLSNYTPLYHRVRCRLLLSDQPRLAVDDTKTRIISYGGSSPSTRQDLYPTLNISLSRVPLRRNQLTAFPAANLRFDIYLRRSIDTSSVKASEQIQLWAHDIGRLQKHRFHDAAV